MKDTTMKEEMKDHEEGIIRGHINIDFRRENKEKGVLTANIDFAGTEEMMESAIVSLIVGQADAMKIPVIQYLLQITVGVVSVDQERERKK